MALTPTDVREAASRVSSAVPSVSRVARGVQDRDSAWDAARQKVARAISSEPDVVLYLYWLWTNKTSAVYARAAKLLEKLAFAVAGWRLPQKSPSSTALRRLQRVYARASSRPYVDSEELDFLRKEVDSYIAQELVPNVAIRGRQQSRGKEALAAYGTAKKELLALWPQLRMHAELTAVGPRVSLTSLREEAVRVPMSNLGASVAIVGDNALTRPTELLLQLAAASASVQALGREVSPFHKVQIDEKTQFPSGTSYTLVDGVNQVVLSCSAELLGIRPGDVAQSGSEVAAVTAVSANTVTLASPLAGAGTFSIVSAAAAAMAELLPATREFYSSLPSVDSLAQRMARLEEGRAADVRDLLSYLAELHGKLETVPNTMLQAVTRVGGTVRDVSPMTDTLLAFDPPFTRAVLRLGDKLLNMLEDDGMDYAAAVLMQGNISRLMGLRSAETSRMSLVSESTSDLAEYVGG